MDAEGSSSTRPYHEPKPALSGHNEDAPENDPWQDAWDEEDSSPALPSTPARINLIWAEAFSSEGVPGAMGNNGTIPWHLAEDLHRFMALTVSHPVIMGRKTWDSLPKKPLKNRDNIVVSYDDEFRAPGATVADSLDEALKLASTPAIPDDGMDRSEIWIIGGASIFRQCMHIADNAYVTQIDLHVPADTFAPDMEAEVSEGQWKLAEEGMWQAAAMTPEERDAGKSVTRYRYLRYERRETHE